jgi:transcriptional regulator with XRE-family HTH domain
MYSAAEVIRAARRAGGLSQRDLSRRCDVAQPNIAAYEKGVRIPSLAMLELLVQGCAQQLRLELEARVADIDRELTSLLDSGDVERMSDEAFHPYIVAGLLAHHGAPMVLDGHLAARALGAPVRPGPTFAACPAASFPELSEAVVRSRSLGPINRERGGELRVRSLVVRLVDQVPEPVWGFPGSAVPIAGLEHLLVQSGWGSGERAILERLAALVAERGPEVHGLRRWDGPPPEEEDYSEGDIDMDIAA